MSLFDKEQNLGDSLQNKVSRTKGMMSHMMNVENSVNFNTISIGKKKGKAPDDDKGLIVPKIDYISDESKNG